MASILEGVTVVDIASGDGNYIDANMLKGKIQLDKIFDFDQENQGIPTVSDYTVWRKVIQHSLIESQGLLRKFMKNQILEVETMYKDNGNGYGIAVMVSFI